MTYINKLKIDFILLLVIILAAGFMLNRMEHAKDIQIELATQKEIDNAASHYFDVLAMRQWNAMNHGVYVDPKDNSLKPNPYLKNNTLATADNKVLIKVNPAWMTRQISEILSSKGDHFFKITSLNPLNPSNAPDEFETEALLFFDKNKQQQQYYRFSDDNSHLDFMGSLVTTEACLACHADQGYKVGDIRGGIRVSSSSTAFKEEIKWLQKNAQENNILIIIFSSLALLFLLRLNSMNFNHQQKIKKLNTQLEKDKQSEHNLNIELKQAQVNLIQAEKMVAVGQLAAGVAHEINTPLGYIHSNLNTLKQYSEDVARYIDEAERLNDLLNDSDPNKDKLRKTRKELDIDFISEDLASLIEESIEGAHKAKVVIENLREFTGVDKQKSQLVHLEAGLEATTQVLQKQITDNISIIKEFSDIEPIRCNEAQLNQVFMGILLNASHAIKDQGIIYIRTSMDGNENIRIEIEDTGAGIPKEIQNKIFDPFFTTNPIGEGVGLGLSIAYRFIKAHQGTIKIDSTEGKGTKVTIILPINTEST